MLDFLFGSSQVITSRSVFPRELGEPSVLELLPQASNVKFINKVSRVRLVFRLLMLAPLVVLLGLSGAQRTISMDFSTDYFFLLALGTAQSSQSCPILWLRKKLKIIVLCVRFPLLSK